MRRKSQGGAHSSVLSGKLSGNLRIVSDSWLHVAFPIFGASFGAVHILIGNSFLFSVLM